MAVDVDPRLGSQLLGYRLEELLGRGGMGVVYRARDERLKRQVALKLLSPELSADPGFRGRFLFETELAASLEHPNVVPIHDAGEHEGRLYLVMRYVNGGDLRRLLAEEGRLAPERAVAVLGQVAAALDAAHEAGLVHRDVKPSNVLLDRREHVYLADFGLTRRLAEQAPGFEAGLSLGTPAYVAPEQIESAGGLEDNVGPRSDQYSLACLLYECLAAKLPFARSSQAATLFAHLEEEPPSLPGLEEVFARALAKDPDERYESCTALVAAGREALGIAEPRPSRWPLALAATVVMAALLAAGLLVFFVGSDGASSTLEGRALRIDPVTGLVTRTTSVGDGPVAVAAGGGRVWVASQKDGTLWQLDPSTETVTKVPAVGRPYALAIHDGSAYVASTGPDQWNGNLSTYDVVTGGRVGGLPLFVCSLAAGSSGVWVAGCPNVHHISAEGATQAPRIDATIAIPYARPLTASNWREALTATSVGGGSVWVVGDASDRRLWRIDPVRRRITQTVDLGFAPGGVATGAGAVWVTDQLEDRVVRIDVATGRPTTSIGIGRGAGAVAFGAGSVWAAGAIDHTVSRIDPETGAVVNTIRLPASPTGVAIGEGAVWVVGDAR